MKRFCLGLAGMCLLPMPALADGPGEPGKGCGGDAYTFAEVVPAERSVREKGPIMVLPDTLCADLAGSPSTRIESLNVFVDPRRPAEEPQSGLPGPTLPYRRY